MDAQATIDVLIIEDSETDAKLVVRELQRSGFSPRWERVDTAPALRDALRRKQWQVVIADSSLPRLGPLEALTLTKEIVPDVPFVIVSGTIREELAVRAIRAGAADYVNKEHLRRLGPAVARELAAHPPAIPGQPADQSVTHTQWPPVVARTILEARDAERRHIGRDLHEHLGQLLTALRLALECAQRQRGTAHANLVATSLSLANDAIEQVHDFSFDLWPGVLEDMGLPAAIRWLADRRQARWAALQFHLELASVARPSREVETACFHIVQEALTNVLRHARARRVMIRLRQLSGSLEVAVCDDGAGFEVVPSWKRNPIPLGTGLRTMKERAVLAGGELEIDSAPTQGTTVRARFPAAAGRSR